MSRRSHLPQPDQLLNRELSWLAFNQRVLEEATDPGNPLLERVKFFCITSSNLDEFFEVRVAGLRQQVASRTSEPAADGLPPVEALAAVRDRAQRMVEDLYRCWREQLVPELEAQRIRFLRIEQLEPSDLVWVENFYLERVHPVLTPLAIDQAHPFPLLLNKMLNVALKLVDTSSGAPEEKMGVVQVPSNLPRLVRLPRSDGRQDYIFLGRIIGHFLGRLFAGMQVLGHWNIRVTRNGEFYRDPEDSQSLLVAIEQELHNRLKGEAVRLEVSLDCPPDLCQVLLDRLQLEEADLYRIEGPLHPGRIMSITDGPQKAELRDPPFVPTTAARLRDRDNLFEAIRDHDILLHHPYESFNPVVISSSRRPRIPRCWP
jgi:polyphosphate kinase